MIISCPKCETSFALPDELYRPGKKARCSQCGNVFSMPQVEAEEPLGTLPDPGEAAPKKAGRFSFSGKKRTALILVVIIACFLGIAYGSYLIYKAFTSPSTAPAKQTEAPQETEASKRQKEHEQRINSISLDEVRQFVVDNDKLGRIVVVQGVAVNTSDTPKEFVTVEGRLMSGEKQPLVSMQQIAGVPLTLFQLQVLGKDELAATLNNRIAILTNNTNIPAGGKVPFVLVFPTLPKDMRTFEVRVIDVRDSAPPSEKR